MKSKIIFGQMIDYFRNENSLTMEELGRRLGKNKSSISRWISGERYPKIEEIEEIAKYFNTDDIIVDANKVSVIGKVLI